MFRSLALGLIRFYQKGISPLTRPSCRFHPTCSAYAYEAIERYGALRGGWIFLKRFARCHPFGGKGYDPVPDIPPRGARSGPDPATSSPSPGSPPAAAHPDPPEARA